MRNSILEIKKKITPILKRHNVRRAAVFDSYTRKENKKGSDIDILIEFEKDARKSLLDLVGLRFDLEDELKIKVDVLTYNSIHPLLRNSILNSQKVIL